jgi:hypothetical protein
MSRVMPLAKNQVPHAVRSRERCDKRPDLKTIRDTSGRLMPSDVGKGVDCQGGWKELRGFRTEPITLHWRSQPGVHMDALPHPRSHVPLIRLWHFSSQVSHIS